jgi:putative salt-induced outer membrane protein
MRKTILALALVGAGAHAEWQPTAELGFVSTTGNSEASSFNTRLAVEGTFDKWTHEATALAVRGEADGEANAERYQATWSSHYSLAERRYLTGNARYERDDFSPFQYQATATVGYGWYALKDERQELLLEAGPGIRQAERVSGESDTNAIARGLVDYSIQFTETAKFFNTFLVEAGESNTFIQNDTGISVKINAAFSLKAGYQIRRNSETPVGTEAVDTLTTVNLVWQP